MSDQEGVTDIGGTLRLGSYPCVLDKTSKAYELYGKSLYMNVTDTDMKLIMITEKFLLRMV